MTARERRLLAEVEVRCIEGGGGPASAPSRNAVVLSAITGCFFPVILQPFTAGMPVSDERGASTWKRRPAGQLRFSFPPLGLPPLPGRLPPSSDGAKGERITGPSQTSITLTSPFNSLVSLLNCVFVGCEL